MNEQDIIEHDYIRNNARTLLEQQAKELQRVTAQRDQLLAACQMVLDDPGLTASANDVIRSAIASVQDRPTPNST